jgi:metal-responsive CopG/Arc/MetJ family transcriptional regulator
MAENEKQLNVWLPEELHTYIAQRAKQEKRGRNQIIADLIRQDMAQRSGQFVEHNSLLVMREMVAAELRQAHAQLRHDLREDREHEKESRREWVRMRRAEASVFDSASSCSKSVCV